jgi:AcrR family transcriptional regulator
METLEIKNVSIVLYPNFKPMSMETKDRVLQGAEELFFKYGIKSVTMDDIAKHLSISKKTIYQFYSDKNEIVDTLMKLKLADDKIAIQQIHTESENVITEVFGLMKHMSQMFSKMNPNLFYDLQKYHPDSWKLFNQFKEDCIESMVETAIKNGVKDGLVRADINTKIIARLRMEEIQLGFNAQVFPPDKFKIVDVQLELLDHFLHGICTLKGHKLINKYKQVTEEE